MATTLAVLIPVFNRPQELLRSIESVLAEPVNADIIVVDDGSSPALVPPDHERVIVLRQPENRGIEAALNLGLEYIFQRPYEFIARLDAGDLNLNDRLAKQMNFLRRHSEYALLASHVEFVDLSGRPVFRYCPPATYEELRSRMHHKNCFHHPAMMIRTECLREVGVYRRKFPACEDYDLAFRILRRFKAANLGEILVRAVLDPRGISAIRRRRQMWSRVLIQLRYFRPTIFASYIGLMRSLVLLAAPQGIVMSWKRFRVEV